MSFSVINPATGETVKEIPAWDDAQVDAALAEVAAITSQWQATSIDNRSKLMKKAADVLRANKDKYAAIITEEMGKLINDSRAEVEKCALACD